jgi:hypothetical protein
MRSARFFLLFLLSFSAHAAEQGVDLTPSVILSGDGRGVADSSANPGNRILGLPSRMLGGEGRLEAKANASIFDLTLRPRASFFFEHISSDNHHQGDLFFQEAIVRASPADWLNVSAGRIQFGWGPSESVSPTNWFAPEIQWQPSPYYEQLGVYRGQWNFSWGQGFSFLVLHEFPSLRDHWSSGSAPQREPFRYRWLGKAEWNWNNTNEVLGFVGGQNNGPEGRTGRLGGYGSWTINDAWQVYYDSIWRQVAPQSNDWKPFGVAGARYTFPGGAEVRLEGIHNGAGQDKPGLDRNRALLSRLPDSVLATLNGQRDATLLTRDYVYGAFRWSNPAFLETLLNNPSFAVRALESLTESSGSLLGSFETGLGSRYSLALFAQFALGPPGGEMRQVYDRLAGVALKAAL